MKYLVATLITLGMVAFTYQDSVVLHPQNDQSKILSMFNPKPYIRKVISNVKNSYEQAQAKEMIQKATSPYTTKRVGTQLYKVKKSEL